MTIWVVTTSTDDGWPEIVSNEFRIAPSAHDFAKKKSIENLGKTYEVHRLVREHTYSSKIITIDHEDE
jgi:hypothetical protein